MIRRDLRAAMPSSQRNLANDPWDRVAQMPYMPGPPPEFTISHVLDKGWEEYLAALPQRWRNWLGTRLTKNNLRHRYKQFNFDENTDRLVTSKGDDVEQSSMFRESGVCMVDRPARRRHFNPRAQRAVSPFLFTPSLLNQHMQQVQNIALGMGTKNRNPVHNVASFGVGENANIAVQIALGIQK